MGLITKEVEVVLANKNIKHFESLGYEILREKDKWGKIRVPRGTIIKIKVEDLSSGSDAKVDVECDNCGKYLKNVEWCNYLKYLKDDGKYYCNKCAKKLYGKENELKSRIKNGKSFEHWCLDNNRQDILYRWDYKLNELKPSEITFRSSREYYFKCPKGIHESELKIVTNFVRGIEGVLDCKQCNSFAQWGIDNLGEDFLDKYWDWEKNKNINPWIISKNSGKHIYIKCQEKDYHGSYNIQCYEFAIGIRCSYCVNKKVHPLDSLGTLHPQVLKIWSNKNKKSPYEYSPMSHQEVYWKCPEGKHEDYPRIINVANNGNFRCPECNEYKGEKEIDNILIKFNIPHDSQYKFSDLKGVGNGLLKFDFPVFWDKEQMKLKILIEYDGIQHFRPVRFGGISKERAIKNYKQQVKNDMIKNLYCAENNIQLIRIPYWEYDNIEKYLRYYLIENSEFDY